MTEDNYSGIVEDPRKSEEKELDWGLMDIAFGMTMPKYLTKERAIKSTKLFFKENQFSTSSCMAHAGELALRNDEFAETGNEVRLLQDFIYRQRFNFPNEGMALWDLLKILRDSGAPERGNKAHAKTEAEINGFVITDELRASARRYRAKGFITLKESEQNDIDNIVELSNSGKAVVIITFATNEEWRKEKPEVIDQNLTIWNATVRHGVCVLPNSGYIEKGKRYFIIQDSAHFGGKQIRHISEDWVKSRIYGAGTTINMLNDEAERGDKPQYEFTRNLKRNDRGYDVHMLQKCLMYLGYLPTSIDGVPFDPTYFYGAMTHSAVAKFQKDNADKVLNPLGLTAPTGNFGTMTRGLFNEMFK